MNYSVYIFFLPLVGGCIQETGQPFPDTPALASQVVGFLDHHCALRHPRREIQCAQWELMLSLSSIIFQ